MGGGAGVRALIGGGLAEGFGVGGWVGERGGGRGGGRGHRGKVGGWGGARGDWRVPVCEGWFAAESERLAAEG